MYTPILLTGTPRQRGRIHGETLRVQIHDVISRWHTDLEKNGKDPAVYTRDFLSRRNFKPAFQRWTPGLLEEIEGIGEGANVDLDTIYSLQLLDEVWVYDMEKQLGPLEQAHHCSGLGVFGEGSTPLVAQNMDLPGYCHRNQALMHIKEPDSDLESFVFTFAGCVGVNMINSAGVGACLNTLIQLEASMDGLPVAGVLRGLMACRSGAEADTFLRAVKHASGQNYLVGSPQDVVSYECSANKVAAFAPLPTRTWHTNHPLVNDDCGRYNRLLEREREATLDAFKNSFDRLSFLEREVGDMARPLTVERVLAILSSHETPVCRDYVDDEHALTFGCLVMETSAPPLLRVSFGPGCANPLHEYRFS
jgi:isopenicillin-N N-acyltransferase like protein